MFAIKFQTVKIPPKVPFRGFRGGLTQTLQAPTTEKESIPGRKVEQAFSYGDIVKSAMYTPG
jgi:hypothetical protein